MDQQKTKTSKLIAHSIVPRRLNRFFGGVIRILFRKVDFDNESLLILNEEREKGITFFASYQSSNTSLLLLNNLLRKHNLDRPALALGFRPYLVQIISIATAGLFRTVRNFFDSGSYRQVDDETYIAETVSSGKPVVLSLLSRALFRRRYLKKMPDLLQNIVIIQQKREVPVYIFPQIMFWNRNPERTRTIITTKATGDRGLISGFFSTLRSMTPAFMRIAPPVNLKEFIAGTGEDDPVKIATLLRKHLMEIHENEKRTILGPVIKTQQEMMEQTLYHENTLTTIQTLIGQKGMSEKKLRKQAYKYFKEIAADFSIVMIKYFERSLGVMFRKIFRGIEYDIESIKKIREASKHGPVIFIPSHKSHMDYLIISSIFYREKMIPPHILSGANLTFFPMGTIFRRSGAFFMRRSFKGKELYTTVLKQYIKTLINERYSIEFFLEGGRTRSGKVLHPKLGILKYLIEAVQEGYSQDLVFVPTTINYSRILEENSYSKELKGKEKKSESTSNFVKSRKLLKRNYGKVFLTFNEPVLLSELQAQHGSSNDNMIDIAFDLTQRINTTITVTPYSLVFASILSNTGKGFSREKLQKFIFFLRNYLTSQEITLPKEVLNDKIIIEEKNNVIEELIGEGFLSPLKIDESSSSDESVENFWVINSDERPRINFYKNTILHYFIPLVYTSTALAAVEEEKSLHFDELMKTCSLMIDTFKNEFVYSKAMISSPENEIREALRFMESQGVVKIDGDEITVSTAGFPLVQDAASLVQELLESYIIAAKTVISLEKDVTKKELGSEIRKQGVTMYHLSEIQLPESLAVPNYNNALKLFADNGDITYTPRTKKEIDVRVVKPENIEELYRRLSSLITTLQVTSIKKGRSPVQEKSDGLQDNVH